MVVPGLRVYDITLKKKCLRDNVTENIAFELAYRLDFNFNFIVIV